MQTLKYKAQSTNAFFGASIKCLAAPPSFQLLLLEGAVNDKVQVKEPNCKPIYGRKKRVRVSPYIKKL